MNEQKPKIKPKERLILQQIYLSGGRITPYELSQKTGISYVTVKKYIRSLEKKGLIGVD